MVYPHEIESRYVWRKPVLIDLPESAGPWYESLEAVRSAIRRKRRQQLLLAWVKARMATDLSDLERDCVEKRYLGGMPYPALSSYTGETTGRLRRLVQRALRKLRIAAISDEYACHILGRHIVSRIARDEARRLLDRRRKHGKRKRKLSNAGRNRRGRRQVAGELELGCVNEPGNDVNPEIEHETVREPHHSHVAVRAPRRTQEAGDLVRPRRPRKLKKVLGRCRRIEVVDRRRQKNPARLGNQVTKP